MSPELYVATKKCPVVAAMHKAGETPDTIILLLTRLKDQLVKDVEHLTLLVPKRVKLSDGSMRIWRCPEECIPEEEFSPWDIGTVNWKLPRPEPTGDTDA
jgi:hypothetical protein